MSEEQANLLKQRTAWLSIISNTALVLLKLVAGILGGAVSLVSEAAHSAVDLLAAIIAFFAVRKAVEPPDREHMYGHGKFENLSSAAEALLIVFVAVWIVYESIRKFGHLEQPEYLGFGIAIMIVSIVVNIYVSNRLMKVARATHSQALEADALHLKTDVWTSVGVLIGLVLIWLTGWLWIDPVIAIVVAGLIFKAGYEMTIESARELTDMSLPFEDESVIVEILREQAQVIGFHKLRTRRSGAYRMLDVHIVMDRCMPLEAVHAVCDQLETKLKGELGMCDVMIHPEPSTHVPEPGFQALRE